MKLLSTRSFRTDRTELQDSGFRIQDQRKPKNDDLKIRVYYDQIPVAGRSAVANAAERRSCYSFVEVGCVLST